MIEVHQVSHRFGERTVLRDVTLRLTERRIGVIGGNGSGKSTFARLLNGLITPTRGRVLVDGLDTRTDGKAVRRKVGFVFQDPDAQIIMPTVAEDVAFGLRNRGLEPGEVERRVDAALTDFGLAGHRDHPAHLLSGGQKQLLAVCSALVLEPSYVVLDEPTTLLDHRNTRTIAKVIRDLPQRVITVTHDLDLAGDCERVVVLHDGCVVADAQPHQAIEVYLERAG